jgi:2-hydroxychromene-2-carboxylate isomerase
MVGDFLMAKKLEFLFDFGGPNSYLAYKVLPELGARTGAEIVYTPILLGGLFKLTNNQAPLIRYAETPAKRDYEMLEFRRFIEAHKLPFRMNPHFPVNSMLAMRGAVAAERVGVLPPYIDAVMIAMWQDGANLAEPEVLRSTVDHAGLDGAALLSACEDAEVKAELAANTERAAARGAFGVPTFFVGDEMFWGKERLGQVEAALAQ